MTSPTVLDILAARRRIAPYVPATPLRRSDWLSEKAGRPVHLKLEAVSLTHSFKIRGAFNVLLRLRDVHPDRTACPVIVTASAGNHGRAMACAAERLGMRVVIFTPATAPRTKRDAIRRHGADLHDDPPTYDEAETSARAYASEHGGLFISPYNHGDVIAGAGTIALELVEACPDLTSVFIPLGGGGLASGVGLALRAATPQVRLIGVEAAASTAFTTGLANGAITPIEAAPTLADGLAGNLEPGSITFPLVQRLVDEVALVDEAALQAAIRGMAAEEHLIVEGAAAAAIAAVGLPQHTGGGAAAVIVTGANIDVEKLAEVLSCREARM